MKYLIIFLFTFSTIFAIPVDGIQWGMSQNEVRSYYKNIKRVSFNNKEELYRTEAPIGADIAVYDFLFFDDSLIQVKISNKYPRQNTTLSKSILDRIQGKYIFDDHEKTYVKKDNRIKQIEEYSGESTDGRTHIVIKIDRVSGKPLNIFIFTDNDFYNK